MRTESALERRMREYRGDPDYILEGLLWDINEEIVRAMERKGLSRADLARKLGTSAAYVTKLLRGDRNLTLRTVVRVAAALGIELTIELAAGREALWASARRSRLRRTGRPAGPKLDAFTSQRAATIRR